MVACSSISIYATDTAEEDTTATTPTVTSEATTTDSTVVEATTTTVTAEATTQTVKRTTYSKYRRGLAAYIRSVNSNIGTDKSLSLAGSFIKYANRRNLDPKVLMAIAENESHFYTGAWELIGAAVVVLGLLYYNYTTGIEGRKAAAENAAIKAAKRNK